MVNFSTVKHSLLRSWMKMCFPGFVNFLVLKMLYQTSKIQSDEKKTNKTHIHTNTKQKLSLNLSDDSKLKLNIMTAKEDFITDLMC